MPVAGCAPPLGLDPPPPGAPRLLRAVHVLSSPAERQTRRPRSVTSGSRMRRGLTIVTKCECVGVCVVGRLGRCFACRCRMDEVKMVVSLIKERGRGRDPAVPGATEEMSWEWLWPRTLPQCLVHGSEQVNIHAHSSRAPRRAFVMTRQLACRHCSSAALAKVRSLAGAWDRRCISLRFSTRHVTLCRRHVRTRLPKETPTQELKETVSLQRQRARRLEEKTSQGTAYTRHAAARLPQQDRLRRRAAPWPRTRRGRRARDLAPRRRGAC